MEVKYPTFLEFAAFVLRAFPKGTVIPENSGWLTIPGVLDSRMKEHFEQWVHSRWHSFEGQILRQAFKYVDFNYGWLNVPPLK